MKNFTLVAFLDISVYEGIDMLHFFSARKRSLGQGNVFTRACHHRSHDQLPGRSAYRGSTSRGRGMPTGGWADPLPELEKRTVRILLECFLFFRIK